MIIPDSQQNNDFQDNQDAQNLQKTVDTLKKDLKALTDEFYKNNFSAHQDFNKKSSFNTTLNIPKYASLPATCEQNDIIGVGGIAYICSSQNVWTKIGLQS
jgi:hypothetical protein